MTNETGTSPKAFPLIKVIKLLFVSAVALGLWGLILWQAELVIDSVKSLNWIVPAAGLVFFIPFMALSAIVMGRLPYFFLIIALSLTYLFFFPINIYAVLAMACLFLGFWRAYFRTQFELQNNIKFGAHQIVRRVSGAVMLAFLLVVSFNVLANVSEEIARDDSQFYSNLANLVTKGVLPVVERQLPHLDFSTTLDQYVVSGFVGGLSQFGDLPAEIQKEQISQGRREILAYLNIEASGGEPLSDIASRAIEAKLKEVIQPYAAFLPLIYGLAIFSLLRILAFFVEWLGLAFGALLFWILRRVGFLKITLTQIMAEHVTL